MDNKYHEMLHYAYLYRDILGQRVIGRPGGLAKGVCTVSYLISLIPAFGHLPVDLFSLNRNKSIVTLYQFVSRMPEGCRSRRLDS